MSLETITVPKGSTSKKLVAQASGKLMLVDKRYEDYDFVRDEGGKTFKVMVWKPWRATKNKDVRKYFQVLGFEGNAAAFVVWVMECSPQTGLYISIPPDDAQLYRGHDGYYLFAPSFENLFKRRELSMDQQGLADYWSFVAFREIKTP